MTEVERLQDIRERIDEAKDRKAKAEGTIERIEKTWAEEHELPDAQAAKTKIEELETQIEQDSEELETLLEELEEKTQWDEN